MVGFLFRVLIVAIGLWLASELVPGLEVKDGPSLLAAALILGIINAVIRPIVVVLTLPITILTFGLIPADHQRRHARASRLAF
jgi:putative membrane protein